ncbi:hypothetical protein LJB82_00940 [Desulfovibrio sp. OttesenSCG-928-M16]|nr:hypothetical protein [Desulfovibrio sp. OttesenSCG-928-M16]
MAKRPMEGGYPLESAPMEQVRELLFGAQLKDMETRFKRQEERFLREIADARDSLKSRLDSLENFMKSETGALLNRLKDEQNERGEALKAEQRERAEQIKNEQRERVEALTQLSKDLAATTEGLERKIAKVSGTLDAAERELRQLLLSESSALSGKIEEKYQDALNVLANTAAQIRHDMVYRSSLASMFTETAVKLSGQWTPEVGNLLSSASSQAALTGDDDDGNEDA